MIALSNISNRVEKHRIGHFLNIYKPIKQNQPQVLSTSTLNPIDSCCYWSSKPDSSPRNFISSTNCNGGWPLGQHTAKLKRSLLQGAKIRDDLFHQLGLTISIKTWMLPLRLSMHFTKTSSSFLNLSWNRDVRSHQARIKVTAVINAQLRCTCVHAYRHHQLWRKALKIMKRAERAKDIRMIYYTCLCNFKNAFLHRQWLLPLHSSHMTMVLTTVKTNKASNHCVRVWN